MKGTSHLAFGLATAIPTAMLLTNLFPNADMQGAFIVSAGVGALLVDIDNAESTIGQLTRPISDLIQKIFGHRGFIHSPLFIFLFYFGLKFVLKQDETFIMHFKDAVFAICAVCVIISLLKNFKENKLLKSIILFIVATNIIGVCYSYFEFAMYGIIFGMVGHIFLDLMTVKGDPLLYPIPFKKKIVEDDSEEFGKRKKYEQKYFHFLNIHSGAWYETTLVFASYVLFFICLSVYNQRAIEINNYNFIEVVKSLSFNDVLSTINLLKGTLQ